MKNIFVFICAFFVAVTVKADTQHRVTHDFKSGIKTDTVSESTSGSGVTIDSVTLQDGGASYSGNISKTVTNGGALNIKANSVTDDTDSGAGTHVLTGVIPAGVVCQAVTCYVNTVIAGAGASTFSLGDGTDADLYGTGLAFAQGTTVDHTDYTASPATQAWSSSAGDLTMTADAGQFDSGNITCTCFYFDTTAPTS